jgi:hypothetical protein
LKVSALHALRAAGYLPLMAFEDLEPAVKAWREAGLPCAQVRMLTISAQDEQTLLAEHP